MRASSSSSSLLSLLSSSTAVKRGPCLLTLKKNDLGFRNQVHEETSFLLLGAQDQRLGAEQDQLPCGSTGTSTGNCQETETCMVWVCHTPPASPKLSFRAPWRVGNTVVSRGNVGWTTAKNGHLCPNQTCSQGPPAEKTGRGSPVNHPSCPPVDPIGTGPDLN